MAGFQTKTFSKHDDYMTPKNAWESIIDYIPKDKVIHEPFYGDGKSGQYLRELGLNVFHEDKDFFTYDIPDSICVSNPPFTMTERVLQRLKELDRPFILILPSSKINTQYFRRLFSDEENPIKIIIPRKRIQFLKMVDGVVDINQKRCCNFDCFYYCWKIDLPRDIIWLSN